MSKQIRKKVLGSGLDALLGEKISLVDADDGEKKVAGIQMISPGQLQPNPDQPREHFNQEALEELAESIRKQGIIQPILAEKRVNGSFLLVAGERRWRAAKLAGLRKVPVIVREFSPVQKLEIALVENVQREDLTPMEEARAYRHLMDILEISQQEVADKVGKKRSTVANSLRLLKLPETMRIAVDERKVTAGHARALLAVINPADQELLYHKILSQALSVRSAEAIVAAMNRGDKSGERLKSDKKHLLRDPEIDNLEQRFIEALGTKVSMKGSLGRGKMEISWFNRDDLDRIYELLIGNESE